MSFPMLCETPCRETIRGAGNTCKATAPRSFPPHSFISTGFCWSIIKKKMFQYLINKQADTFFFSFFFKASTKLIFERTKGVRRGLSEGAGGGGRQGRWSSGAFKRHQKVGFWETSSTCQLRAKHLQRKQTCNGVSQDTICLI